jgi:hypothetical protein
MKKTKNAIKVENEQIKECLIKTGLTETAVDIKAKQLCSDIKVLVSDKYQSELDYYLQNLKPSDSTVGKEIARLMPLHFNSFFDTLTTVVTK